MLKGVSVKTLQRWDNTYDQYLPFKGMHTENDNRQMVIYTRVSTRNLHVFSCWLYGLRKYKKQIEGDGEIAKELQDGNKSNRGAKG